MESKYYIASCVFSTEFPALSYKIQNYITDKHGMQIARCCVSNYKVREFEEKMQLDYRSQWSALPAGINFRAGDIVYSICHNCLNIIEETKKDVKVLSLWELILSDPAFPYPDYGGMIATAQDCWRSRERRSEQNAVRQLLTKMNIRFIEADKSFENTDFCGASLYRPQPIRNPRLAPIHYEKNAAGKFSPHSADEQKSYMADYCKQISTDIVICYCHYCLEGLQMGGKNGLHIAELLFP